MNTKPDFDETNSDINSDKYSVFDEIELDPKYPHVIPRYPLISELKKSNVEINFPKARGFEFLQGYAKKLNMVLSPIKTKSKVQNMEKSDSNMNSIKVRTKRCDLFIDNLCNKEVRNLSSEQINRGSYSIQKVDGFPFALKYAKSILKIIIVKKLSRSKLVAKSLAAHYNKHEKTRPIFPRKEFIKTNRELQIYHDNVKVLFIKSQLEITKDK